MNQSVKKYLNKHSVTQSQVEDNNKRQVWESIKRDMPELAEFIPKLIKVFGKPKKVTYERTSP